MTQSVAQRKAMFAKVIIQHFPKEKIISVFGKKSGTNIFFAKGKDTDRFLITPNKINEAKLLKEVKKKNPKLRELK